MYLYGRRGRAFRRRFRKRTLCIFGRAGAAYLAGLGCGLWGSMEELVGVSDKFREFIPSMSEGKRSDLIGGWKKAVQAAIEK